MKTPDQIAAECDESLLEIDITSTTREQRRAIIKAAIEEARLEIWRDAPNQPDIQESVIAKLDLVHRHAIAAAQQPLVDALRFYAEDRGYGSIHERARTALAKVKEWK